MSKVVNTGIIKTMINCFVCDQRLTGEKVNLASSLSIHSKVTLPEKISQLIGDDYVVAVTEQDCVCKRCASLLNHMDKLENELTLVKRALTSNISQKYKISIGDGQIPAQQTLANGLKTDSASDYEDEGKKITSAADTSAAALAKKKTLPVNKMVPTPKPIKPAENVTKLKIYKCGFCSYQSKELSNVRVHMKIHIRANKTEGEGEKSTTSVSSPLLTPKQPVSVRRRVFRCQVCSASFDDRNKCLEHISRDHTAAGRKLVEQKQTQDEQQSSKQADSLAESSSQQAELESQSLQQEETAHEEMDTSELLPTIALYSCDTCTSTFDNDVDFANHVNEHVKDESCNAKSDLAEADGAKEQAEYSQIPTQSDSQAGNEDETPKDPNIGLDIEAMIAALHSEGPESGGESMPNI